MTTDDRFIEAAANTARQRDEWKSRAEKAEAERDVALEYADPRRELTKASNDLAAALARERDLRLVLDKLAACPDHPDGCYCETCSACRVAKLMLSAPQDDSSLREFGRKCIEAAGLHDEPGAVVDAVLKGAV